MGADYIPAVGDRVRHQGWAEGEWADVIAVDDGWMWVRDNDGGRSTEIGGSGWIRVEPVTPLRESWLNVDNDGCVTAYDDREEADVNQYRDRLAVVHIWTDADGVDHAEIERT